MLGFPKKNNGRNLKHKFIRKIKLLFFFLFLFSRFSLDILTTYHHALLSTVFGTCCYGKSNALRREKITDRQVKISAGRDFIHRIHGIHNR